MINLMKEFRLITCISFVSLIICLNSYSQEKSNEKSTFIFGVNTSLSLTGHINYDIFDKNELYGGLSGEAQILIPASFSKNIKYVVRGVFNISRIDLSRFPNNFYGQFSGGGLFAGLNAYLPLYSDNFSIGFYCETNLGFVFYNYYLEDRNLTNVNYYGALPCVGTDIRGGICFSYKIVSLRPAIIFQYLGNPKTSEAIQNIALGVSLGIDI
jgi:hypothetical protein